MFWRVKMDDGAWGDEGFGDLGSGGGIDNGGPGLDSGMYSNDSWEYYTNDSSDDTIVGKDPVPVIAEYTSKGLINPYSGTPPDIAAKLLNAQFAEWESTFKPIEQYLLSQVSFNNPEVLTTAVGKAKTAAEQSTGTMSGVLERMNKSQGVQVTPEQQQVSKRLLNLATASNVASAANNARENVRTQDEQILLGVTPNYNIQGIQS